MLSDADRQRIREEEIFRSEVREMLSCIRPTQTRRLRSVIWNFLNTSVGGWLLTTVLAGFVVWLANSVLEHREAARQEAVTRDAVRREVSYRLAAAEHVENPQLARNMLDDTHLEPEYEQWEFGGVLYKLGDVSGNLPDLLDHVMYFKTTIEATEDFHERLAELRKMLEKYSLINPQVTTSATNEG